MNRMGKTFTKSFVILSLLISTIIFSACQYTEVPIKIDATPKFYCGDGDCRVEEQKYCKADCGEYPQWAEEIEKINSTSEEQEWWDSIRERPQEVPEVPVDETPVIRPDIGSLDLPLPEKGFSVASRNNLLSLNENISTVSKYFTSAQMRQVLGGGGLRTNTEAFGPRYAFYEQFMRVAGGRVVFGYDDETEKINSYLEFSDGDPIIEYVFRLNNGIFKFFEGEIINFLGHQYIIAESSNISLKLVGATTKDEINFRDKHSTFVNGDTISTNIHNTNLSNTGFRILVRSDDNIKILPGQSLTKFIDRELLLTNRIDLTYEGLTEVPSIAMRISRTSSRYKMNFQNNLGINYTLPLAKVSPFGTGNDDYNLVFTEGATPTDFNIKEDDYFLISNNRELGGITTLLKIERIDYDDGLLLFDDPTLENFFVVIEGNVSKGNAYADLMVYNVKHRVHIGPNKTLSIDLNGDGIVNKASIPLVIWGNSLIRLENTSNNITLRFITPATLRENSGNDLETKVIIDNRGITVSPKNVKMEEDRNEDALVGMNDYGTLFILRKDIDDDLQRGRDLVINHPLVQRLANVIVKAYE